MYLVAIAWLYVAVMMAVAEAAHPSGTLIGAIMTLLLYGVGPVALVLYILGTPQRKRRIKAREAAEQAQAMQAADAPPRSGQPDAGGQPAGAPVAPVREEP